MKITNEIFQVGGAEFTANEDAAIYLINFNGDAALVDAGCGHSNDKLFKNINKCIVPPNQIRYLLLTHCHFDHTGGAKALKEKFQCKIVAHHIDAKFLEEGNDTVTAASWYGAKMQSFLVDRKLHSDKEDIELDNRIIKAIHIPGHSPGSVVYLTESEGLKVLFGQDIHGPLHPSLMSNKEDYIKSLNLLISLDADILCEGHFGVYKGKEAVKNFIESYL
ncbi:MAG: MBL fold metallo-hydrolase [Desulfobacterales bacterium]|nr:MBL fold metallo-hydrolase [Desulfobacterales bacterium]